MEATVRSGSLVRARAAYGCPRAPRLVVDAGLAAPGRRRALVAVDSLPEPLEPVPSPARDGAMAYASQADEEVRGDNTAAAETSSPSGGDSWENGACQICAKKQCPFGQSFHLVGDDPALGLWDPEKAVALQWAEGYEWVVEKDLPANKLMEFKFLLRDTSGKLQWQNEPNRSLQTGKTVNTLVVYEDWGGAENQKVEVEGEESVGMEDAVVSYDNESRKDNAVEDELQMDVNKEVEPDESIVAEDEKSAITTDDSDKGKTMKANEADPSESLPPEELKMLGQLLEIEDKENGYTSCADENYAEKTEEEHILPDDGVPVGNRLTNAYEHDFLWGWKALQQLLMNLGFKMDAS